MRRARLSHSREGEGERERERERKREVNGKSRCGNNLE